MDSNKNDLSKFFQKSSVNNFLNQMDSFFNDSFKNFDALFNHKSFEVRVTESSTDVIVKAILPGYKRNQIHLDIIGNVFRISVEKIDVINDEQSIKESSNKMERIVSLPFTISEENTKANFNNGILTITTPKKKPRNVEID